jgi:hypothetical protein
LSTFEGERSRAVTRGGQGRALPFLEKILPFLEKILPFLTKKAIKK